MLPNRATYHISLQAAAHILHHEANQWEEENNAIVKVVKLMAKQMLQMAQFAEGRGELKVSLWKAFPQWN